MSAETKNSSTNNPAIGTDGSKRGHFLTINVVVTKNDEFSWPKGMCPLVRIMSMVIKMSASEKVIVGLKSISIFPRSLALTHNSHLVACKKALKIFFPRYSCEKLPSAYSLSATWKKDFHIDFASISMGSKYNWTKESKGPNASRMGQGYTKSNPPHVFSWLCTKLRESY